MTKPSYEELEWPAPQAANESDDDFFLRILREHRQSHADWIPHLEKHAPENEHTRRALGNADIQRADVRRYDKLIGIFEAKCSELARVRGLLQLAKTRIGILVGRMRGCDEMQGQKHELSIPEGEAWMEEIEVALGAESADIGKLDAADRWTPELRLFHKLWGKAVSTSDYVKGDWQKLEHELFIKPTLAGSAETGGEKA